MHNFDNLEVYRRSLALTVSVVKLAESLKSFRLADQIVASAVSIPSNIAEGAERESNKDFAKFLRYSAGSAAELRTQLLIVKLAGKLPEDEVNPMIMELKEILNMLRGLIKRFATTK